VILPHYSLTDGSGCAKHFVSNVSSVRLTDFHHQTIPEPNLMSFNSGRSRDAFQPWLGVAELQI